MPGEVKPAQAPQLQAHAEKPNHYTYLKEFRVDPCKLFKQHQCTQHRPYTCFYSHFANQRRRRPVRRKDGYFNYSPDIYCNDYDENTGICKSGEECPFLHRVAGDVERKYHLRYYKTCLCVYGTDAKGNCLKNGAHCAFAHGPLDLRPPVHDIREVQSANTAVVLETAVENIDSVKTSFIVEDPAWQDASYVLANYKTDFCNKSPRQCRQGYACPFFHNGKDKRRPPRNHKYRSTPCPSVKHGDEWGDPEQLCDQGEHCQYCHTRTEQQFHPEIYKSTKCNDMLQHSYCPRGPFCAFAHCEAELSADRENAQGGCASLATLVVSNRERKSISDDSSISPTIIEDDVNLGTEAEYEINNCDFGEKLDLSAPLQPSGGTYRQCRTPLNSIEGSGRDGSEPTGGHGYRPQSVHFAPSVAAVGASASYSSVLKQRTVSGPPEGGEVAREGPGSTPLSSSFQPTNSFGSDLTSVLTGSEEQLSRATTIMGRTSSQDSGYVPDQQFSLPSAVSMSTGLLTGLKPSFMGPSSFDGAAHGPGAPLRTNGKLSNEDRVMESLVGNLNLDDNHFEPFDKMPSVHERDEFDSIASSLSQLHSPGLYGQSAPVSIPDSVHRHGSFSHSNRIGERQYSYSPHSVGPSFINGGPSRSIDQHTFRLSESGSFNNGPSLLPGYMSPQSSRANVFHGSNTSIENNGATSAQMAENKQLQLLNGRVLELERQGDQKDVELCKLAAEKDAAEKELVTMRACAVLSTGGLQMLTDGFNRSDTMDTDDLIALHTFCKGALDVLTDKLQARIPAEPICGRCGQVTSSVDGSAGRPGGNCVVCSPPKNSPLKNNGMAPRMML